MTVSIDTLLGGGGLIATIVIGYLGVNYTLKYRKRIELVFLKNASISLFETIVKNVDDIEINFKGKRIGENLILFKGTFFNNGNIDIDNSIIHKPLEIELPKNYEWVRHKIVSASDGVEVISQIQGKKLVFRWDLLKESEYFTFDSLVEYASAVDEKTNYDIAKELVKEIKFHHRITDLKEIGRETSIPRPMPIIGMSLLLIVLLAFISFTAYTSLGQYIFPSYNIASELIFNSTKQFVVLCAKSENEITLISKEGDKIAVIPKDKLIPSLTGNIDTVKKPVNYWILILTGSVSILYFVGLLALIYNEMRVRVLYRKLKNVAELSDNLELEGRRDGFKLFERTAR